MTIWAIVPVKSLQKTKGRLTAVLTPTERAQLTCKLLTQTLTILNNMPIIDTILVVTRDKIVTQLAESHHATVLAEEKEGLINAVTVGKQFAEKHGATKILILPSDLPFISAADINQFISARNGQNEMLVCSDQQHQGTNALFLSAAQSFQFHYGINSYQQHLKEAQQQQAIMHTINIPNLQFDLDTEADLIQYQQTTSYHHGIIL